MSRVQKENAQGGAKKVFYGGSKMVDQGKPPEEKHIKRD